MAPSATSAAQTPAAAIPATVSSTRESISAKRNMKRCEGRRDSGGGHCLVGRPPGWALPSVPGPHGAQPPCSSAMR